LRYRRDARHNRRVQLTTLRLLLATALCALGVAACDGGDPPAGVDSGPGIDGGSVDEMDAGRDAGAPAPECEGVPPPCSTLTEASCATVMGCAVSQCIGTPVACDRYPSAAGCDATAGCRWNGSSCGGTATRCTDVVGEPACDAQQGCTWSDAATCTGTGTRCADLSRAECTSQPGCRVIAFDAGSMPRDAGPPLWDGGGICNAPEGPPPHAGCNPDDGVECDGDWEGRCTPACAATECCSPQANEMTCVPRNADGSCPAADLWVDDTRFGVRFEYRYFGPDDCELVEGCVAEPGMRRLLRFDTWTPNTGGADMFLGVPSMSAEHFEYSDCHGHYHFNSYAEYELLTSDEMCVAAVGHKQAFCLLDYYEYPCGGEGEPRCSRIGGGYTCTNQGIRRDSQDVYDSTLDCQFVDVTGVPPGEYVLRVRINTEHILYEEDYANNEARVRVTVPTDPGPPALDISSACAPAQRGVDRTCGFTRGLDGTCTPGETITLGCSAECGYGSCTGDTVMLVCETAVGVNCTSAIAIAENDDSGCGTGSCSGGDCCSAASFVCPTTGTYTVWTGPYDTADTATCTVAVMP
jgi:hypothetical protein